MARFYREKPANCKGWMYSDDDDFNECLREAEVYDADTMQPLWIE